MIYKLFFA